MLKVLLGMTGVSLVATGFMWMAMGKAQARAETAVLEKLTIQSALEASEAQSEAMAANIADLQRQNFERLEAEREISEERRILAANQRNELNEAEIRIAELLQGEDCFLVPYPDGVVDELRLRANRANGVSGSPNRPLEPDPISVN